MIGLGLGIGPFRAAGIPDGASLTLDFMSGSLDSRVSFSRASIGTYTDDSGVIRTAAINQPRFDFGRGLLIEEARTNLLLYSDAFDNAIWSKSSATVTANVATAPDGTATADKLVEVNATAVHQIDQATVSVVAGTTYTFVIYARAAERKWLRLALSSANFGASNGTWYNIETGVVGTNQGGTVASIVPVGNGWFRCVYTRAATVTGTASAFVSTATADLGVSYLGDNISGILLWGAQLEAGAFPTSYIPTGASAVTRAADVASMPIGGWFNAAAGTLAGEFSALSPVTSARIVSVNDGTLAERLELIVSGSGLQWLVVDDNTTQAGPNITPAVVAGQVEKFAGAYALNDFQAARSGSLGAQDTVGTVPTVTTMRLGGQIGASAPLNGHIRRIRYWNVRLADAKLQEITS